jgi:ABC-2 type transport system permease protein
MSAPAGLWTVTRAVARRNLGSYLRRPELLLPSLLFPLVFFASFAGGLSALGHLPAFHYAPGYTTFQDGFIFCQTALFSGLFTAFSLAYDLETGFARRLFLASANRTGIPLGYAAVAVARAILAIAVVTAVALAVGMRVEGTPGQLVLLCVLGLLLVLIGYGWAAGIALRFRTVQAGPAMQTPVFLAVFLAPAYVPLQLLRGWIHSVANFNPVTYYLEATRGLLSGHPEELLAAFLLAAALAAAFWGWTQFNLKAAEAAG